MPGVAPTTTPIVAPASAQESASAGPAVPPSTSPLRSVPGTEASSTAVAAAPAKGPGSPASGAPRGAAVKSLVEAGGRVTAVAKSDESAAAAPTTVEAKRAASPEKDPAFQAVVHRAKAIAKHQAVHVPAHSKAEEAHAAAVSPPNEVPSRAAARQTSTMEQQKPKRFNREAFKAALKSKIKAPQTLEEADDFKEKNNLGEVKSALNSQVVEEKQKSQGALPEEVAAKPDTSGIEPKPSTPIPDPGLGAAQGLVAAGAAPKPASDADISLATGPKEVDKQMADAGVTEQQLQDSNEPAFQAALGEKKKLEKESVEAPHDYRKQEVGMLGAAHVEAQAVANQHTTAMHGARKHAFSAVAAHQSHAKQEEEKNRAEIAGHIEAIYQSTKERVEKRLKKLDEDANKTFDDGATGAQVAFENYVSLRMDDYKEERYSGWTGWAKWGKDKLVGMPDAVNKFYQDGHDNYVRTMEGVIDRVATIVETGLNEAMGFIEDGKVQIDHYVDKELPANLRGLGKQAASAIQNKFDALEQSVSDKQDQLVDALAKKYNDNMEKLNSRIEEMKAANKGLADKVKDAVVGAIKAILALKDMLFNVLSRAASAIGLIIAHPIDFLGHLVDAGKLGFSNFVDHIGEHLKQGFMEWLFGAVAETGIQLPKDFDLPGILSLVLQVLGLTYRNIRSRAVKILGEKVVKALETAAEIFKILITKGPGGLWEYIKDKIGDLKTMVIEKIKSFIMEKVIIAGITWVIGLLNPASAFIKACKAIYDIIMFFVEHGKQILDLVNAIIDSITAIAKGAIGAAANFVETSLARTIPVIIGFLASLLGVGSISEKIKEVIEAIRKPINEAIDWVINLAVKVVKAAGKFIGGISDKSETAHEDDPEKAAKIQAGLIALHTTEAAVAENGELGSEDAKKLTKRVKDEHQVFKTLDAVPTKDGWEYEYTASERRSEPSPLHRRFHPEQIYKLIRDIATVRYGEAAANVGERKSTEGETGIEHKPGAIPAELAPQISTRKIIPAQQSTVPISIGSSTVFAKQGSGAGNVIVAGLGKYPEIAAKLKRQGFDGPVIENAVSNALRTGTGHPDIMRLVALMFGAEPARAEIATVTGPLTLIGLGRGQEPARAFGEAGVETPFGGGTDPVSMEKAAQASRRADQLVLEGRTFREGTKIHARSKEFIERIVNLAYESVKDQHITGAEQLSARINELLDRFEREAGVSK